MARTRVETWELPPVGSRKKAIRIKPDPVGAVDGKWSSDESKRNLRSELISKGFEVRVISVSVDRKLLAYVRKAPPARKDREPGVRPAL